MSRGSLSAYLGQEVYLKVDPSILRDTGGSSSVQDRLKIGYRLQYRQCASIGVWCAQVIPVVSAVRIP